LPHHGTKFAVEGRSEALHVEMAAIGVRVKNIEPGAIATDFSGRSFDFNNDENKTEYQGLVRAIMASMAAGRQMSPAELVADVIYQAATRRKDQLRYVAGSDAVRSIAMRKAADDPTYVGALRAQFGI